MGSNTTTVRVDVSTKELILKHSKRLKLSQNKVIEHAFLCAENSNFTTELPLKSIAKNQAKETNRLIGFIKKQDENLFQVQQNLIHLITSRSVDGEFNWFERNKDRQAKKIASHLIEVFKEAFRESDDLETKAIHLRSFINDEKIKEWL